MYAKGKEVAIRLDHIAYRVADRHQTADFFIHCFNYRLAEGEGLTNGGFKIQFSDGSKADCLVLEPPEKKNYNIAHTDPVWSVLCDRISCCDEYHMAPEFFISDGSPDSIVGKWVANRNGIGGIHHIAYQVESVQAKMVEWRQKGYAEFTSEEPLTCPGLTQVFTCPSSLTGVITEFIERTNHGFCIDNVKDLMLSTKDLEA